MGMDHTSNRLTEGKLRAKLKAGRYPDGGNLYLLVGPTGARSWMLRLTIQGRRRDIGLGACRHVSLAEARTKARAYTQAAAEGRDPVAEHQAKVNPPPVKVAPTFAAVAEDVLAGREAIGRNDKHRKQWRATLETYAYPSLGQMPVDTITQRDVLKVLGPIWTTKAETARRLKQRLGVIFDWAKAHGHRIGDSPMSGIELGLLKQDKQVKHMAALPYAKIAGFVEALRASNADDATKLCLEFMILTAARPGEARMANWDEFETREGARVIPGERMKASKPHAVPLSPRALEIIEEARQLRRKSDHPLVFPARSGRPLSDATLAKLARSLGFGHLTAHGFRSTFRDWAGEMTSYPSDAIERALAHGETDDVRAAYFRSDLWLKRVPLMQEWARYVGGIEPASNVVPLRAAAEGAVA